MTVSEVELPKATLIANQAELGFFTDCFCTEIFGQFELSDYITAFYTSPIFRIERFLLRLAPKGRSTDQDVAALAAGQAKQLAIWTEEFRRSDEVLMNAGKTKSWLHLKSTDQGSTLYFGTVVLPEKPKNADESPRMGKGFELFMGLHRLYSRVLLRSAARNLRKER